MSKMKVALLQTRVYDSKERNIENAVRLIKNISKEGAAAFNMTTGPAHWELNFRARALHNQSYTIGVAPARNMEASYALNKLI